MTAVTSKEAQNRFGELLETAQREPVTVTRHNRPVAVVMSQTRYEELEALEDAVWAARAKEAAERGFIGTEETRAFIEKTLGTEI